VQAKAVLHCQKNCAGPRRVQNHVSAAVPCGRLNDIRDQLSPRAQPLGEFGPAPVCARHKQDHLHVQKRRTAERILPAAVHCPHRVEKFREIAVLGEQIEVAPNGLLDVILEHGDDQLVLAPEIRIERPARETRRRRDGLDAGPADPLFLEDARRRLVQLFAGVVPGGSGSNS
jgi:hypothetical protein